MSCSRKWLDELDELLYAPTGPLQWLDASELCRLSACSSEFHGSFDHSKVRGHVPTFIYDAVEFWELSTLSRSDHSEPYARRRPAAAP